MLRLRKNVAGRGRYGLSWPYAQGGAPPLKFGHEPGRWVACEYAVRGEIVEQIVLHFGRRPDRDAFADAGNARFERWYGPGSVEGEDAFERDWGEELLWINPPFNMFNKVLDKIQSDRAHAILIIPRWSARVFLRRAWGMAVDFLEFPKGTPMFERGGKEMKGTSWDTYAMLVCGHYPKFSHEEMRAGGAPLSSRRG